MDPEKLDYWKVLADMETRRTALDAAMVNLRVFLNGQSNDGTPVPVVIPALSPNGDIPAGSFLGKSIPEAAKLCLQIMNGKQLLKRSPTHCYGAASKAPRTSSAG
jgi:hypothetical protein